MHSPASFVGYTTDDIGSRLLVHLRSIQHNPKRMQDAAIYLGRTTDTLDVWIKKEQAEAVGETACLALGLLEKEGKIPRLPEPVSGNAEAALCVAFARQTVTAAEIAADLGHQSASVIFVWIKTGKMTGFSKIRLQWALSKRGVFNWSWFLKLPYPLQRVATYAAINRDKNLQDLLDTIPETVPGRTAIKSLVSNPAKFVSNELKKALEVVTPEIPDYVMNPGERGVKAAAPVSSTNGQGLDDYIASLDLKHRILGAAAMLFADLRLLMGGHRDADPAPIAGVLNQLRAGDRSEVLFKLENVLGVVNTAEEKAISRWLKEEVR